MAEVHRYEYNEDTVFFIREFAPFKAGRNLMTLQRLLITPALKGITKADAAVLDQEGIMAFLGGLTGLLEGMTEAKFDELLKLLIDPTHIAVSIKENEKVPLTEGNFNLTGLGVVDLIELMAQVVKVNYEDFGYRAVALFGEARAKVEAMKKSQESSEKAPKSTD